MDVFPIVPQYIHYHKQVKNDKLNKIMQVLTTLEKIIQKYLKFPNGIITIG